MKPNTSPASNTFYLRVAVKDTPGLVGGVQINAESESEARDKPEIPLVIDAMIGRWNYFRPERAPLTREGVVFSLRPLIPGGHAPETLAHLFASQKRMRENPASTPA